MRAERLDDTDRMILQEMRKDCRRSYRELSAACGMSPPALMERVKRMEGQGLIIGYCASLDYLKLGYEFMAMVQIDIRGDLLKAQEAVSRLHGVASVYDTTGKYDSVALLMCKSRAELSALVKKILKVPGVETTNTSVVLNVVKRIQDFEGV